MSTALQEPSVTGWGELPQVLAALSAALDAGQAAELWPSRDRELAGATVACGRLVSRTTALLTRLIGRSTPATWPSAPVPVRRRRGRGTN